MSVGRTWRARGQRSGVSRRDRVAGRAGRPPWLGRPEGGGLGVCRDGGRCAPGLRPEWSRVQGLWCAGGPAIWGRPPAVGPSVKWPVLHGCMPATGVLWVSDRAGEGVRQAGGRKCRGSAVCGAQEVGVLGSSAGERTTFGACLCSCRRFVNLRSRPDSTSGLSLGTN